MTDHTEDQDDEVRSLIRAHLRDFGESGRDWLKLEEACQKLGYTRGEVEALARPIKAAMDAAQAALGPSDVAAPDFPADEQKPKHVRAPRLPVKSLPLEGYEARMRAIDHDITMLRDYSLQSDPDSPYGVKIRFPNTFLASVYHQEQALKLHMSVGDALFELERVQRFFKALGAVVRDRLGSEQSTLGDAILNDFDALVTEFMGRGRGPVEGGRIDVD